MPGVNGYGQLQQAPAPAPLRGGWSSAAGGRGAAANGNTRGQTKGTSLSFRPHNSGGRGGQNGYQNGFTPSGRAGLGAAATTRGGYTPIDRGDQTQGIIHNNPTFNPRQHNNVPPPSSLNDNGNRGRGRGRGGALRGNRGGPRGRGNGNAAQAPTQ
jgi:5'-3' exoribonuclease 1